MADQIEKSVPIDKWNSFNAKNVITTLGKAINESVGQPVSIPTRVKSKGSDCKDNTGVGFSMMFGKNKMNKKSPEYQEKMLLFSMMRRRLN